jgi:two-component system, chemotaxis family, sensor kinase Cph1
MPETNATEVSSLSACDVEPIHIPGAIQPHGVLLVLSELDLTVSQVSENSQTLLGLSVEAVLGHSLTEWLDERSLRELRGALARPRVEDANPLRLELAGRTFEGSCHRHLGATILELERVPASQASLSSLLRKALGSIQACTTLGELQRVTAEEVRRMTGFDRVVIYRFDSDGHGSVVAEAKDELLPPYLGLHYPASDIPLQARALYLLNWLRIIPDARYERAVMVPAARPDTHAALDLSYAVLRSVSPVHLEYMRNMGATASMSISLVTSGRLWGLISCVHHQGTRYVGYEDRSACEVIGRLTSLQTSALEELERSAFRASRRAPIDALERSMRAGLGEVLEPLADQAETLLSLVGATGAALSTESSRQLVGLCPAEGEIDSLLDWLDSQGHAEVFSTACLSALYPAASAWQKTASGLLCVSLPGKTRRRLLWFRPEVAQTINWSGDPSKDLVPDASARLHPRRSFELWKEELRARSLPWTDGELAAAVELRRRAVEIDLVRQVERGEQAVRARDDLVAVVSHDLKNPLSVVQMQSALLVTSMQAIEGDPSRRLRAAAERILRAVDRMNTLIHDLLDLSKIEAGRFTVQATHEDARAMVEEAVIVLEPLGHKKNVTLSLAAGPECAVMADRDRIFQVMSNLIGNALKFSPERGVIRLSVRELEGEVLFTVKDDGPGIDAGQLPNLFNRYWQAARSSRQGSGLGLYIAKGIVEAHGGRIWAESTLGLGAAFLFVLPRARS